MRAGSLFSRHFLPRSKLRKTQLLYVDRYEMRHNALIIVGVGTVYYMENDTDGRGYFCLLCISFSRGHVSVFSDIRVRPRSSPHDARSQEPAKISLWEGRPNRLAHSGPVCVYTPHSWRSEIAACRSSGLFTPRMLWHRLPLPHL